MNEELKIRFYYSPSLQVRRIPVITNAEGEVLFVYERREATCENIPRVTVASCYDSVTNTMKFGVAICSPEDQFCRKTGRELAKERALKSPKMTICGIHRKDIVSVSKKYAKELIDKYVGKYVQLDL